MFSIPLKSLVFGLTYVLIVEGMSFPNFQRFQKLIKKDLKTVESMKIDDGGLTGLANNFSPFLLRGAPMPLFGKQIPSKKVANKLVGFKWESCGAANQAINIRKLTLAPSPLVLPGTLTVSFDVEMRENIPETEVLNAKVEMKLDHPSVTIPCIGNIGSCDYTDICSLSQMIPSCPPQFVAAGVPCQCPFQKGNYTLPPLTQEIDASVFLPGEYTAKATITSSSGVQMGCYIITVEFE